MFVRLLTKKKIIYRYIEDEYRGHEFEVIQGLQKRKRDVDIIYFEHHYDTMIEKNYTFREINRYLIKNNFQKIYKLKMPFRKTF